MYEIAKFYLNESQESSKRSNIMEDTIEDLKVANQRRGNQFASKTTPEEADKKDTRLWDSIVTDMPRPLRAETELVVRDRTFPVPGYRTWVIKVTTRATCSDLIFNSELRHQLESIILKVILELRMSQN